MVSTDTPLGSRTRRTGLAGFLLGFALGGFFDGILLHQILQWHHLLSGLEGGHFEDLRLQILADGLFHLAMYLLAAGGLWLLWRARSSLSAPDASRHLIASALIGFGSWHIIDAVLSHWLLGIHRIRMDAPMPIVWDLAWFLIFGVAFVVWGWLIRPSGPSRPSGRVHVAPAALVSLTVMAGAAAALPPRVDGTAMTMVVFLPGANQSHTMSALVAEGGRLVWSDKSDGVWAVSLPANARTRAFYSSGAMLISGTLLPVGCLDWFSVDSSV